MDHLLKRGVEEVIDKEHLEERLKKGDKLRVKLGIDPTSPNIHIGRAVQLWKLRAFQDQGHTAVFIVGDFTGLIGDTSDKDSERPMLTKEQVELNMKSYFDQAYKILDKNKTEVHYNSEWLNKLNFIEISKLASLFGLHEFESREVISKRLKEGKRVSLHELLYPLMQGYDSVAVHADVEIGGTDQRFNLLAGRTIQPHYKQKPQDIIMTTLLEGTDGRKMSSSWGNVINITDSPEEIFGKTMSIEDSLIIRYFKLATNIPDDKINKIEEDLKKGENPKEAKAELATSIVSMYYDQNQGDSARENFENTFSKGLVPENIKEIKGDGMSIIDFIVNWQGISKSEAKRLIDQKAITVDSETVDNWETSVSSGQVIRSGSHKFAKVE